MVLLIICYVESSTARVEWNAPGDAFKCSRARKGFFFSQEFEERLSIEMSSETLCKVEMREMNV